MSHFFPEGLSSKGGAYYLLRGPIYTSGDVYYFDSVNGDNANVGTYFSPKADLTTFLGYAAGDIVVIKGQAASMTATAFADAVTVVGETVSEGEPEVQVSGSGQLISLAESELQLRNLKVNPSLIATATRLPLGVSWRLTDFTIEDTSSHTTAAIGMISLYARLLRTKVVSVAAAAASAPATAISGVVAGLFAEELTLDDGPYGRTANAVIAASTRARILGSSLLRGPVVEAPNDSVMYAGTATYGAAFDTGDTIKRHDGGPFGVDAFLSTEALYVDSQTGDDTDDGSEDNPFATLVAALAAATENTVIVMRDGHAETLNDTLATDIDALVLVGEGTVTISLAANTKGFEIASQAGLSINHTVINVNFVDTAPARTGYIVTTFTQATTFVGCTFTSPLCVESILSVALTFRECQFIVPAGTTVAEPKCFTDGGSPQTDVLFDKCTFDGGDVDITVAISTAIRFEETTLLNGADIKIPAGVTGYVHLSAASTTTHLEVF